MHWPDIFFPGKKRRPEPEPPPPFQLTPEPPKPQPSEAQPPTIKPVPPTATGPTLNAPAPAPVVPKTEPPVASSPAPPETTPATLPATHGVVLRAPTGQTAPTSASPPQIAQPRAIPAAKSPRPMKNIEQLMAEADPVRTLRQTGNVRILKPLSAAETAPVGLPAVTAKIEPAVTVQEVIPAPTLAPVPPPAPVASNVPPRPLAAPTPVKPAALAPTGEIKKAISTPEPMAVPPTPPPVVPSEIIAAPDDASPFILRAGVIPPSPTSSLPKIIPPVAPSMLPIASILRRKARMNDVARIVLPPKREDTQHLNPAPEARAEPAPTVVPPAFPVAAMTARATQHLPKIAVTEPVGEDEPENFVADVKPAGLSPVPLVSKATAPPPPESNRPEGDIAGSNSKSDVSAGEVATESKAAPEIAPQPREVSATKIELVTLLETVRTGEAKLIEPPPATSDAPKIDPEAHRPEPSAAPEPRLDPVAPRPAPTLETAPKAEAPGESPTPQPKSESEPGKPDQKSPEPAASVPPSTLTTDSTPEKREFHLANGERVAGTVLSETPDAIYIEHATLGVLTIPRSNIAKRLVEIILINGDRIVGDILAETADTLYVRHASLGMLTVPRAQRSTRVVEAILKDGDRILGEVLTETDAFTVIRSASLGTITIPHTKLAMLNRKVEQIELKSLPPPAPELKDKS